MIFWANQQHVSDLVDKALKYLTQNKGDITFPPQAIWLNIHSFTVDDLKYVRVHIFMTLLYQQSLERSLNHLITAFCVGC